MLDLMKEIASKAMARRLSDIGDKDADVLRNLINQHVEGKVEAAALKSHKIGLAAGSAGGFIGGWLGLKAGGFTGAGIGGYAGGSAARNAAHGTIPMLFIWTTLGTRRLLIDCSI